jgi:hypothetical protein
MEKSLIFWILMLLWLVSIVGAAWPAASSKAPWLPRVSTVVQFILFVLLGVAVFGDAVK